MKKLIIGFYLALAIAATSCSNKSDQLTIMSYNIHNGIGLDKITDYDRIGALIKEYQPDVVAIQEIDSATTRSGGEYVLGRIEEASGMYASFAPAIDFQGGKYGIGILSRQKPLDVKRLPLPGSEEPRALIIAEFPDYVFACTHLSLTEADRNASARIISEAAKEYSKPFFIAGDFNAEPESQFIQTITTVFTPLSGTVYPTFPADNPEIVIDYIMAYNPTAGNIIVEEAEVIEEPLISDHRPVIVKAKL